MMTSEEQIKVIELIVNDDTSRCFKAVINKGGNSSITIGDKFLIVGIGKELFDPDTKESLGYLEIVKGKAIVTHVQPKMSTIESINYKREIPIKTVEETVGGLAIMLAAGGKTKKTTYEEKEKILLPFDDIQVGDIAKKLED